MAKKIKKTLSRLVDQKMAHLGIEESYRPKAGNAQMTMEITRLSTKQLMNEYSAMVAWHSYVNEQLAKISINLLEYERKHRYAMAEKRFGCSNKTKWRVDDEVHKDPNIQRLARKVEVANAHKIALEAVSQNYDNKAKCLSRELSRRICEKQSSQNPYV